MGDHCVPARPRVLRTDWNWTYSISLPILAELNTSSWACSRLMLHGPQRHTRWVKGRLTAIIRANRQSKKEMAVNTVPGITIAEARLGNIIDARWKRMPASLDTTATTSPALRAQNQPNGRAGTRHPIFEIELPRTLVTLMYVAMTMLIQFTRKVATPKPIRAHNCVREDAGSGPRRVRRKGVRTTKARSYSSAGAM